MFMYSVEFCCYISLWDQLDRLEPFKTKIFFSMIPDKVSKLPMADYFLIFVFPPMTCFAKFDQALVAIVIANTAICCSSSAH